LPMRGDDVLALSTLVDELTKCCKPLQQRQCVTARAYCFVYLASLVHPLSPLVPCRSASNFLEKQQHPCQSRYSPQVAGTLGPSKEESTAQGHAVFRIRACPSFPSPSLLPPIPTFPRQGEGVEGPERRPWEKMITRERGHSRSGTLRLKVRSVLSL